MEDEKYNPEKDDDIELDDEQEDSTFLDKRLGGKQYAKEFEKQNAHWEKGQFVTIKPSYINKQEGYSGMVAEVVEDDTFGEHLGYIVVKVLSEGKYKDKHISIEWMDVRKASEQEIVKHMVIDAL